jgi:hypothetical protein
MTAETTDPRIQAAREAYAQYQRRLLATGPLEPIADWVRSGCAPAADALRSEGLRTEGPPETPAGVIQRHELATSRKAFTQAWGFSIPCAEAVAALRGLAPLVEVGAGTGYWAALLRAAGHDVVATDLHPKGRNTYGFEGGAHTDVEGLAGAAAVRKYADRDIFCSWPSEGESWALGAAWALRPGRRLAIILNPGNTATPGLRRYLSTRFRKLATVSIPQFPGAADDLTIYEKL